MKQILWLRASCAGLSPSEVDAVNNNDEVVALLHPPQRNAIREVDVHALFGNLHEARGYPLLPARRSCLSHPGRQPVCYARRV